MQDRIDRSTKLTLEWVVRVGSFLAASLGAATLLGWLALTADRTTSLPSPPVAPPTAIGLFLSGSALAWLQAGHRRIASIAAWLLLVMAGSLALLRVLRFDDPMTAFLLGEVRPLRHGHLVRIAGTSATALILFSIGMLAMAGRWRGRRLVFTATTLCGLSLTGITVIFYAYDVDPAASLGFYRQMSPPVAVGLFVLFLASLAIEPERGWLRPLISGHPNGRASRAQIALIVTIPFLAGFLLLQGEQRHLLSLNAAMALMVICTVVPMVIQILRDGRVLDVLETRRQEAVAAEALLNVELEQRVRDRTARLTQSQAWLRGFVDQSVDGLALLRLDRDGQLHIETLSPSLAGQYDAVVGAKMPQPALDVLPAEVVEELLGHVAACIAAHGPHRYRAHRTTRKGVRLLDVIMAPITLDNVVSDQFFAASVRDITDAEQREELLRQSQKMEAVGQLTGGLAHDFNNLLAGISGSLEMIQSRLAQNRTDDIDRYLSTAQEAGRRAAALTHRLLAFSRRQTLDPRPVEIDRIIADMEDLIRRTMGPAVTVIVRPSPLPWTSLIDANQFENALLNLCLNARDAMPNGGRLTITTFNDVVTCDGTVHDLPAGDYVRVRVADTGVGMSPDVVARAFDPFFTTKPIGQGTGLGLSMIYGFARQSGGHVALTSELGRGTFIDLQLPRRSAPPAPSAPSSESVPEPVEGGGRTVLVVDDEPAIRMLVRDVLFERGYRVLDAEDGIGGLNILRSRETIDLLVTDVGLPNGMNGRQMADAARSLRPGLRVLFITGYAEASVLGDEALEEGMELLTKPFTIGRLMDRVSSLARSDAAIAGRG
ncbi:response regulator [Acetobacteraceae bacterium KSS8]|uniref:histidine kinase n=1 Tax=Endosaccharibacter trunci TaxID=2812733 RepID=A0ABT1W946_9PROT|nr:response regulator [Acetobacteraceae bacterium KSS8]